MIRAGVGATRTGVAWHLVHIPAHLMAQAISSLQRMYEPGGVFDTPLRESSFEITGLDFLSPGGGGPGHSLTSTDTPPSIEEVGRIITGLSDMGHGEPGVGRGKKNGRRCPPGYRWDYRKRRCVKLRKD
jgi:hypothetical protein